MKKRNIVLATTIGLLSCLVLTGVGFSTWYFLQTTNKTKSLSIEVQNKVIANLNLEVNGPTNLSLDQPKITSSNTIDESNAFLWEDDAGNDTSVFTIKLSPEVTGDTSTSSNEIYVDLTFSLGSNDSERKKIMEYFTFSGSTSAILDDSLVPLDCTYTESNTILTATTSQPFTYVANETHTITINLKKILEYTDKVTALDSNNKFTFTKDNYKEMKNSLSGCSLTLSVTSYYK